MLQNPSLLQNSSLLQNPLCCKFPFAAKSPLLQNSLLLQIPLCYKIPFATKSPLLQIPLCCKGPEGFQRATGKPFGRLRRGEILRKTGKYKEGPFLAFHKKSISCERFRPPAGGRGTFHHWKVPKGCRGRPKGACLMAAPGPPVAKLQCTASLAGARPAGFTSVPGRATVAFGAADPSPGSWAPVYPWSDGKKPLRQENLVAVRAAVKVPCKVRTRHGTRLVAGPGPNQMACPIRTLSVKIQGEVPLPGQGGSGGIPRPFEGGIGGPGGHRGEVGIPPAPLAGGANPQRKNHVTPTRNQFSFSPAEPRSRKCFYGKRISFSCAFFTKPQGKRREKEFFSFPDP